MSAAETETFPGPERVLVAFDGSPSARTALEWGVAEAQLHAVPLEVWTVSEPVPHDLAEAIREGGEVLDDLKGAVGEMVGDDQVLRLGHGGAADVLCEICGPTDLLVVGTRGRSQLAELLLGSVSRACLAHAPCSVVVVPASPVSMGRPAPRRAGETTTESASPPGTVLVGIDASDAARRALRLAAGEARLRGANLLAVHAVQWDHLGVELLVPTTRQLLAWGRDLVRTELAITGVEARATVVNGEPREVLVRHSATADLLVLGSRGHNPLAALAVGSTTDYCARHAHCAVMVVR